MAFKTKTGIVLRNPAEKGKRYSRQLSSGVVRETGQPLGCCDRAWRLGYLQARQDSANAFKANQKRKRR